MELRAPERLVLPYTAAMTAALLFGDAPRSALMLGLGGGSQARFLAHHFSELQLTAWESDARAHALARRYFELPSGSLRVIEEDARTGLRGRDLAADLIFVDLFTADGMPPWVRDAALHEACRCALGAYGVLAVNLWVSADDEALGVMDGLRSAFQGRILVLTLAGFRNLVVLAFERAPRLDFASLESHARRLGQKIGVDYLQGWGIAKPKVLSEVTQDLSNMEK